MKISIFGWGKMGKELLDVFLESDAQLAWIGRNPKAEQEARRYAEKRLKRIKKTKGWTEEKKQQRLNEILVVVKLFCNICGLNLLDCCLEAIGTVRFYQWCFAPLRGHAIDKICHFRFFAITQSNQETCFRRPLCCCPHLVWCAVTVIAMWAHMIVGSIGEFLHRVIEFLFRPKFVQIRAFVL